MSTRTLITQRQHSAQCQTIVSPSQINVRDSTDLDALVPVVSSPIPRDIPLLPSAPKALCPIVVKGSSLKQRRIRQLLIVARAFKLAPSSPKLLTNFAGYEIMVVGARQVQRRRGDRGIPDDDGRLDIVLWEDRGEYRPCHARVHPLPRTPPRPSSCQGQRRAR